MFILSLHWVYRKSTSAPSGPAPLLSGVRPSLSVDPIIYTPLSQVLLSIQITAKLPSVDKHGVFKRALAELQEESRGCIEAAQIQEGWSITGSVIV